MAESREAAEARPRRNLPPEMLLRGGGYGGLAAATRGRLGLGFGGGGGVRTSRRGPGIYGGTDVEGDVGPGGGVISPGQSPARARSLA